jgi:hypothetical protein
VAAARLVRLVERHAAVERRGPAPAARAAAPAHDLVEARHDLRLAAFAAVVAAARSALLF